VDGAACCICLYCAFHPFAVCVARIFPPPVRFIGVVLSPLCMVTEFCERGNLFDLLHNRDIPLPWPLRKKMALDAAKGMACA
jgi:hypothetical protein